MNMTTNCLCGFAQGWDPALVITWHFKKSSSSCAALSSSSRSNHQRDRKWLPHRKRTAWYWLQRLSKYALFPENIRRHLIVLIYYGSHDNSFLSLISQTSSLLSLCNGSRGNQAVHWHFTSITYSHRCTTVFYICYYLKRHVFYFLNTYFYFLVAKMFNAISPTKFLH